MKERGKENEARKASEAIRSRARRKKNDQKSWIKGEGVALFAKLLVMTKLEVSVLAPSFPVFANPVEQSAFETNILAGFL